MRSPVSNILAATLFVSVLILSRLPNLVVALMFFSIALWPVRFSFIYQSFLAIKKYNI
jgi:hypothetical protein